MTDEFDEDADALGSYELAVKEIGERVKKTGVIPECLLGDGEHSRRLRAEYNPRSIRELLSEAVAVWIPTGVETAWFRIRARRALAKPAGDHIGELDHVHYEPDQHEKPASD